MYNRDFTFCFYTFVETKKIKKRIYKNIKIFEFLELILKMIENVSHTLKSTHTHTHTHTHTMLLIALYRKV